MDLAVSLAEPPPCERPAPDDAAGCFSARSGAAAPEAAAVRALCEQEPDLDGFERLDKWRHCEEEGVGECRVFAHNLARARNSGFPSTLECGEAAGLSPHEIAALFGWTTGDFRFLNPIARGLAEVTFQDYPRGAAVLCRLSREEVLPYVQVVSAALRKLPPAAGGQVLWRGHRRPVAAEVGAVLELPGFASASHDRDEALAFAAQANAGRSARRSLLAITGHVSGRGISRYSARKREAEVLFPLGARFEVVAPGPGSEADAEAVAAAARRLAEEVPGADIRIVYLRELGRDDAAAERAAGLGAAVAALEAAAQLDMAAA